MLKIVHRQQELEAAATRIEAEKAKVARQDNGYSM